MNQGFHRGMRINEDFIAELLSIPCSESKDVLHKAIEVYDLMRIHVTSGSLQNAEVGRDVFAVHMACDQLCIPFSLRIFTEKAYLDKKTYGDGLRRCKTSLGVHCSSDITLRRWLVTFDLRSNIAEDTLRFLSWYKAEGKLHGNSDWFLAAAFWMVAEHSKSKSIRKKDLLAKESINKTLFENALSTITKSFPKFIEWKASAAASIDHSDPPSGRTDEAISNNTAVVRESFGYSRRRASFEASRQCQVPTNGDAAAATVFVRKEDPETVRKREIKSLFSEWEADMRKRFREHKDSL